MSRQTDIIHEGDCHEDPHHHVDARLSRRDLGIRKNRGPRQACRQQRHSSDAVGPEFMARLISLQPKATEIVSTEDSLSQRTWHNRQRSKNMSTATVTRSTRLIGDPEAIEATLRPSAGLEHQAIALETKHLSRSLVGRVLVNDVSVQVQPGEGLAVVAPTR